MFGLEIVEVAIGLTLIYLLLASICSAIRERIEAVQKTRAVDLERAIRELLRDPTGTGLTKKLYDHPLIYGLFAGEYDPADIDQRTRRVPNGTRLPSYIPASNFAIALLDVVTREPFVTRNEAVPSIPLTLNAVRASAGLIENASVQRVILPVLDRADGDLAKVQTSIEAWFNSSMDRVSGWYRRRTQSIILWLSLIITVAANANTLTIIQRLSIDSSMRQALTSQAQQTTIVVADTVNAPGTNETAAAAAAVATRLHCASDDSIADGGGTLPPATAATEALACLGRMALPLGWADGWPGSPGDPMAVRPHHFSVREMHSWWYFVLQPLIGLLLTAFAVTLGAPFWFDMLNKLVSLRSTLKPKEAAPATTPPPAAATPSITVFASPQVQERENNAREA